MQESCWSLQPISGKPQATAVPKRISDRPTKLSLCCQVRRYLADMANQKMQMNWEQTSRFQQLFTSHLASAPLDTRHGSYGQS